MKKVLFILLILPFCAHAQSIKNLDIKNGFLQFHLGDSISAHSKEVYIPWKNHPDQNEVKDIRAGDQVAADPATWTPPESDLNPQVIVNDSGDRQ